VSAIAIVGMGCRFASAPDLHAFWNLTLSGVGAFTDIPPDRWDKDAFHDSNRRNADKSYAPRGAFLDDIRTFPALALGIPPRRVEVMDPQHRLALEVARDAIHDSGRHASQMPRRTGVFIGVTSCEFRVLVSTRILATMLTTGHFGRAPQDPQAFADAVERIVQPRPYSASGELANMTAATIAQELDLKGPAFTVDSACASAIVAVSDAIERLRSGSIDAAVAGGVYLQITPEHYVGFSRLGAISGKGACRPFDVEADGFVQGDGCGVLVLKRLADAERDGDRVYAVIRGIAMNNDGKGDGPMAPVQEGQAEAIRLAWADAGRSVDDVGYIEAHGTGTDVGDVVEVNGLRSVFGDHNHAFLGSSKGNVGHTMSAAGAAGLIRTALAIHHGVVPPLAGFTAPKPAMGLHETSFRIPTAPTPWEGTRLAAVSSFGFGGTNTHCVLEGVAAPSQVATRPELVVMSAPDLTTLRDLAGRTADAVDADPGVTVAGVARAWAVRRGQPARLAVVCADRAGLVAGLRAVAAGAKASGVYVGVADAAPKIAFLYPGQGAQRPGMLAGIRDRFPVVAETLTALEADLLGDLPLPLGALMWPERRVVPVDEATARAELTATEVCQPALLACGVALTRLLASCGVTPSVVTGHSLGEFTAAAVAGVWSASDAAKFVAARGRAMATLPGDHGAMLALMCAASDAEALLVDGAVLANLNHPRQVVVSGRTPAIAQVAANAAAAGVKAVPLEVSHGFHGPALDGLDCGPLVDALTLSDPTIPVASAISQRPYADAAEARAVFRRHATSPVDFVGALRQCVEVGATVFVQVGAGGPLASFARGSLTGAVVLPLASSDDTDGGASLLEGLGQLWVLGASVDPRALTGAGPVASVPPEVLPRESYWPIKDVAQRALELPGRPVAATRAPAAAPPSPAPAAAEPTAAPADDVSSRVLAVIAKVSAYPRDALGVAMSLTDDLGFDSLMVGDLATGLAEAFPGIGGIPQELLMQRPTVGDIITWVTTARRGDAGPANDDDDRPLLAYTPVWRDAPARPAATPTGTTWVVGDGPLADAIAERLGAVRGAPGDAPPAVDRWIWVAAPGPKLSHVLDGLQPAPDVAAPLLAAFAAADRAEQRVDVTVVLPADDPWNGAWSGVVRAMGREWSERAIKAVHIAGLAPEAAADAVIGELDSVDRSADVRISAEGRAVAGLGPAHPSADAPIGPHDIVLVTGGTRGIGARIALVCADLGALVLVAGRGAPDPSLADAIAAERVVVLRVDVTDRAALVAATPGYRPISVVVHAAGVLADGPIGSVDADAGRLARAVKVDGLINALAVSDPRVVLAIGSWAGRFGNRHQAHYAAANAAMADLVAALPVRGVVIETGPWTGSAMADTLAPTIRQAMKAEGVDFVGPTVGVAAVLDALAHHRGALVLGRGLPLDGRSLRAVSTVSVETHPYLRDHSIEGTPVVPMAGVLDLIASTVDAAAPFEIQDLTLFQGIVVREPTRVEVGVRQGRVEVRVGARRALAWKARWVPAGAVDDVAAPKVGRSPLSLAEFYGGRTFHGPLLQGIVSVGGVAEGAATGGVRTGSPSAWSPTDARAAFHADPLAIDSALQLSGLAALVAWGRGGTPIGCARYVQLRPFPAGTLDVRVTNGARDGDRFTGDVRFYAGGALVAAALGVSGELRALGSATAGFVPPRDAVDFSAWKEVKDLEIRLELAEASGIRNPYFRVHEGTARNTTVVEGRTLVNFSSYNYIGLSGDPRVIADVGAAVARYGTSVSASRVASGERPFHGELEALLAKAQGTEDAVLFTAGHATNVTTIGHLMGPDDLILHDELIHDSILQGIKLSGAARRGFRHDDPQHLADQLAKLRPHYKRALIVVEGVYSMDGDICDLPAYLEIKERWGCLLMVDEAHSFGVVGATGCGVREHFGVDGKRVDLWMGTLSKSLASCGGWIAGTKAVIRYLRYTAPGFVYSAGLTPANGQAALSSMKLMLEEPWRVARLQANGRRFYDACVANGLDTGPARGRSGVGPVITGNSLHALLLSHRLNEAGVNVQPIVYPAVADDAARLRFFLSSTHTDEELEQTAATAATLLAAIRAEYPAPARR
jgi:8-amino-7-oxononanoate synthase